MTKRECWCGKILSKEEMEKSKYIAVKSNTALIFMCDECWENYCYHAVTGD